MALSAVFGFGFAGNMTCLLLCIRDEVPSHLYGGAIGFVMLIAWAGMGARSFRGGTVYDSTGSYDGAFMIAALAGFINLLVLAALAVMGRGEAEAGAAGRW